MVIESHHVIQPGCTVAQEEGSETASGQQSAHTPFTSSPLQIMSLLLGEMTWMSTLILQKLVLI
jgi:hypothetical protein